jgi:type IV secretion system protein VirB8
MSAERSRKRAYRVAATASALAGLALVSMFAMLPLRTVAVRVFRVDSGTGVVDLVAPLQGTQTYNEAVNKYWLRSYVRSREGYMPDEAAIAYRRVALMSNEDQQQRFAEVATPRNPQSPTATIGKDGRIDIDVKAVTFASAKIALVRFAKTIRRGREVAVSHWMATLSWEYAGGAMAESDRELNPLGFIVNDYRIDAEVQ